jgi:hypothetical protein
MDRAIVCHSACNIALLTTRAMKPTLVDRPVNFEERCRCWKGADA